MRPSLQLLVLLLLVRDATCQELQIPVNCISVVDGDTLWLKMPFVVMTLPDNSRIDGKPAGTVYIPAFAFRLRLVDNHAPGKSQPINTPELHGKDGKAQAGAVKAYQRTKELAAGKGGYLLIHVTPREGLPHTSQVLDGFGRVLGDFRVEGDEKTVAQHLMEEGLAKPWVKK